MAPLFALVKQKEREADHLVEIIEQHSFRFTIPTIVLMVQTDFSLATNHNVWNFWKKSHLFKWQKTRATNLTSINLTEP